MAPYPQYDDCDSYNDEHDDHDDYDDYEDYDEDEYYEDDDYNEDDNSRSPSKSSPQRSPTSFPPVQKPGQQIEASYYDDDGDDDESSDYRPPSKSNGKTSYGNIPSVQKHGRENHVNDYQRGQRSFPSVKKPSRQRTSADYDDDDDDEHDYRQSSKPNGQRASGSIPSVQKNGRHNYNNRNQRGERRSSTGFPSDTNSRTHTNQRSTQRSPTNFPSVTKPSKQTETQMEDTPRGFSISFPSVTKPDQQEEEDQIDPSEVSKSYTSTPKSGPTIFPAITKQGQQMGTSSQSASRRNSTSAPAQPASRRNSARAPAQPASRITSTNFPAQSAARNQGEYVETHMMKPVGRRVSTSFPSVNKQAQQLQGPSSSASYYPQARETWEDEPLHQIRLTKPGTPRQSRRYSSVSRSGQQPEMHPGIDDRTVFSGEASFGQSWQGWNNKPSYHLPLNDLPLMESLREDEETFGGVHGALYSDKLQQVKLRGIKLSASEKKRRRQIILVAAALLFAGVSALIYWLNGILVASMIKPGARNFTFNGSSAFGSQSRFDNSQNGTMLNRPSVASLQLPPAAFNMTCSREIVTASQLNIFICENTCRDAACCYVSKNETDVVDIEPCLHAGECLQYSPLCDFIYGPLPIFDLTTSFTDLNASLNINETKNELFSVCDPNGGDPGACIDACYDGYCCFSSVAEIISGVGGLLPSCYDRERCERYIPCLLGIITMLSPPTNGTTGLVNPPDELSEICSDEYMNTQTGMVECVSYCSKALCCLDPNPNTSCVNDNIGTCAAYSPCVGILQGSSHILPYDEKVDTDDLTDTKNLTDIPDVPPAPPNLNEICGSSKYGASELNLRECALACEAASCCFEGSCLQDRLNVCMEYTDCQILSTLKATNQSEIADPPNDIETLCGDTSLLSEKGRIACLRSCYPGICCFDPIDPCFDENILTCMHYDSCEAVVDLSVGWFNGIVPLTNSSNSTIMNATKVEVPLPPANISDVCSIVNISAQEGMMGCDALCSVANCCTAESNNCYSSNFGTCDLYGACLNLIFLPIIESNISTPEGDKSTEEVQAAPDNLEDLCAEDTAFNGSDCQLACEVASCCFNTTDVCHSGGSRWCQSFRPCQVLWNGTLPTSVTEENWTKFGQLEPPPENLESSCSEDLALTTPDCFLACAVASCCNAPRDENCLSNYSDWCSLFKPCEILAKLGQSNITNLPERDVFANTTLLLEVCDPMRVLNDTTARLDCVDVCKEAECCYTASVSNATMCSNSTFFCDEYRPCSVLTLGNNTPNEVCSKEIVLDSNESYIACEAVCVDALCCFLPSDTASSCSNDTGFCEFFEACGLLIDWNMTLSESTNQSMIPSYAPSASQAPSQTMLPTSNTTLGNNTLSELCSEDLISDSNMSYIACEAVCLDASCCFLSSRDVNSCSNDTVFCEFFEACTVLIDWNTTLSASTNQSMIPSYAPSASQDPSQTMLPTSNATLRNNTPSELCSEDLILDSDMSYIACEAVCVDALCCFLPSRDASSCSNDTVFCNFFEACSVLTDWNMNQSMIPSYAPSASQDPSQTLLPSTNAILEDICNMTNLTTNDDDQSCRDMCKAGECCFVSFSNAASCKEDVNYCEYYRPCRNIFENATVANPSSMKTTIDFVCSKDALVDDAGILKCAKMCSDGACCLVDQSSPDSCLDDIELCTQYEACMNLFPDDQEPDVALDPEAPVDPEAPIDPAIQDTTDTPDTLDSPTWDCTQEIIDSGKDLQRCFEMCDSWVCCYYDNQSCGDGKDAFCEQAKGLCDQLLAR